MQTWPAVITLSQVGQGPRRSGFPPLLIWIKDLIFRVDIYIRYDGRYVKKKVQVFSYAISQILRTANGITSLPYSFPETRTRTVLHQLLKGAQRKTMIEKLAPENENKRELDTRQVLAGQASLMHFYFFSDPLIFGTRTRTSFRIQLQEIPDAMLHQRPLYGKRERATRFQ